MHTLLPCGTCERVSHDFEFNHSAARVAVSIRIRIDEHPQRTHRPNIISTPSGAGRVNGKWWKMWTKYMFCARTVIEKFHNICVCYKAMNDCRAQSEVFSDGGGDDGNSSWLDCFASSHRTDLAVCVSQVSRMRTCTHVWDARTERGTADVHA